MNKRPQLSKDIAGAHKKFHTMDSLFVRNVEPTLLNFSFYLPKDVMENPRYEISKPVVYTHDEWNLVRYNVTDRIVYDGDCHLVDNARHVITSRRRLIGVNGSWLIAKVWYGEKP